MISTGRQTGERENPVGRKMIKKNRKRRKNRFKMKWMGMPSKTDSARAHTGEGGPRHLSHRQTDRSSCCSRDVVRPQSWERKVRQKGSQARLPRRHLREKLNDGHIYVIGIFIHFPSVSISSSQLDNAGSLFVWFRNCSCRTHGKAAKGG